MTIKQRGSDVFSDTGAKASDLRSEWNKTYSKKTGTSGAIAKIKDKEKTKGTVQVKNVLYGMNQGFIGVNFDAEIEVPGIQIPCLILWKIRSKYN